MGENVKSFNDQFLSNNRGAADVEVTKAYPIHFPFAVIQFVCGNCYVEARGIKFLSKRLYEDKVTLYAPHIITKTYYNGKIIDKQLSRKVIKIPRKHFCIIGLHTNELDPCTPLDIGISPIVLKLGYVNCYIKVMNVRAVTRPFSKSLALLLPPSKQLLYIKTFNHGKLISVRSAKYAYVQTKRICSREENVIEIEPESQWIYGCACEHKCEYEYNCKCNFKD